MAGFPGFPGFPGSAARCPGTSEAEDLTSQRTTNLPSLLKDRDTTKIIGLVLGKIYRKPWFLPSNIGLSCKIFPSSNSMKPRT